MKKKVRTFAIKITKTIQIYKSVPLIDPVRVYPATGRNVARVVRATLYWENRDGFRFRRTQKQAYEDAFGSVYILVSVEQKLK